MELIEDLLQAIGQYYHTEKDLELVKTAYEFAREAHENQFRVSGEPYIVHPVGVALILTELQVDIATIIAALLHDVLEDTEVTYDDLEKKFGKTVVDLVDGVTKLSKIAFRSSEEQQVENLRKMFIAMARDMRVIIIKLADRLHNMRTLNFLPEKKQKRIARETLDIYAPLAHRLGIFHIKWELEDLTLRYLEPDAYYDLIEKVAQKRGEREEYINEVKTILQQKLKEVRIEADIQGRPKHFYSIYQKMVKKRKNFEDIYDLTAFRVIVKTVIDCYEVLGTVHALWKPIPGRFKDYIAMPKMNMYQSLHTTVIGPNGQPLEVQIRTWEMHRIAEYGIAAHWRYKEGGRHHEEFERKLAWVRQLLDWQRDLKDANEFMETLKIDLFQDEVFVFTPKGDVINLPAGSTPVDYAFDIHTDIGYRCVGAKINGKIVPLNHVLRNGDIIEILTAKVGTGPSGDWLSFVKTSKAKNRIKHWFKLEKRDESIMRGKELLEKELRKQGFTVHSFMKTDKIMESAKQFGCNNINDLMASIGLGKLTAVQIVKRFAQNERREEAVPAEELNNTLLQVKEPVKKGTSNPEGISVKGEGNMLVHLSRCCNPLPGDRIIGYVTRGKGVAIHRADCPNVRSLKHNDGRIVEVGWERDVKENNNVYPVQLEIKAIDRMNLLADVSLAIAETKTNIIGVNTHTNKNGDARLSITLQVRNMEQLNTVINRLKEVSYVSDVYRCIPT